MYDICNIRSPGARCDVMLVIIVYLSDSANNGITDIMFTLVTDIEMTRDVSYCHDTKQQDYIESNTPLDMIFHVSTNVISADHQFSKITEGREWLDTVTTVLWWPCGDKSQEGWRSGAGNGVLSVFVVSQHRAGITMLSQWPLWPDQPPNNTTSSNWNN